MGAAKDPVIVTHEGKRLAIHGSHAIALKVLRRYPIGAEVLRVRDGEVLAVRVSKYSLCPIRCIPVKRGQGESRAGVGTVPVFENVQERAA
jgi:hypothetical protein